MCKTYTNGVTPTAPNVHGDLQHCLNKKASETTGNLIMSFLSLFLGVSWCLLMSLGVVRFDEDVSFTENESLHQGGAVCNYAKIK